MNLEGSIGAINTQIYNIIVTGQVVSVLVSFKIQNLSVSPECLGMLVP